MAHFRQWFDPHQMAPLLMAVAFCLMSMTVLPSSKSVYLLEAQFGSTSAPGLSTTAWMGTWGYCVADFTSDSTSFSRLERCSGHGIGYDLTSMDWEQRVSSSDTALASRISLLSTRSIDILNPIALVLSFVALASYSIFAQRPQQRTSFLIFATSQLSLLTFATSAIFQYIFMGRIAEGRLTEDVPIATSYGPVAYATMGAVACLFVSCNLCFYMFVGGSVYCEGGIRLGQDGSPSEDLESTRRGDNQRLVENASACEKLSLEAE
ncbi:hypothetical protein F5Y15DRAFT_416682 [Xylariaceae sp. FL0016]|nr:hypothetical protein F5Y15DRAFT_416682 [Xylariaceae sp. FL0016]